MFKEMLTEILEVYGPSGNEELICEKLQALAAPYVDESWVDGIGNLIVHRKGTSGQKLLLSAHMDQIGFVITDIDDNGFLRYSNIGGINVQMAIARDVIFKNGTHGVTFFGTKEREAATATMDDCFIDIGTCSRKETEKLVSVGDIAVHYSPLTEMFGKLCAGALDNRISCAIIIEALKNLDTEHDIYAAFTVQEEVGTRGAGPAAYGVEPDLNINIDVCTAGDTPDAARQSVKLGGGPAIKIMDASVMVPLKVREFMHEAARKRGITVQNEVMKRGGTDTSDIQRSKCGIPAGCISIACRYIHTPREIVDTADVMNAIELVRAIAAEKNIVLR